MLKWVKELYRSDIFSHICGVIKLNINIKKEINKMDYKDIQNVVNEHVEPYIAVKADGSKERVRLWKDVLGRVAMLGKGCKRHGYLLSSWQYQDWVSLSHEEKKACNIDMFKRIEKRVNTAISYLERSGLWSDILSDFKEYLSKDEETRRKMCNDIKVDSYANFFSNKEYAWCGSKSLFISMAMPKCWKRPHYHCAAERDFHECRILQAIRLKKDYKYCWENGYDNSIEVHASKEHGIAKAWYSEEYRNCGNGHYYLLLDETHAIFCEDD